MGSAAQMHVFLGDKIERLKLTTNLTDEGAGEVARVLRREQDKTLAASCAPDGTPWAPRETPRKGGGVDVLTNARSAVKVGAIGSTIIIRLVGREYVLHHLGFARGRVRRQIIPRGQLPAKWRKAVGQVLSDKFVATWGRS